MVVAPDPWLQEEDEWAREPVFVQPAPVTYVAAGGSGGSYAAGGVISSGGTFTSAPGSPSVRVNADTIDGERVETHITQTMEGLWFEIRGRGAVGAGAQLHLAQQAWATHREQVVADEQERVRQREQVQQEALWTIYREGNQRQVTEATAGLQRTVEEATRATELFNQQLAYLQNLMVENGFTEEEQARVRPALVEAVRRGGGSVSVTRDRTTEVH